MKMNQLKEIIYFLLFVSILNITCALGSILKFNNLIYKFKTSQISPSNTVIGKLALNINDLSNLDIVLNSTRHDESNRLFYLDKTTLEIKTSASLLTDHKREHYFKALVYDRHTLTLLAKCSISIEIIDDKVNTRPKFLINQYQVQVFENNAPDTLVIRVQAFDADINENSRLTYHLINNDTNASPSPFQIKSDTGEIYAKRILNREQKDLYILNIAAVDNGLNRLTTTTQVFIRVVSQYDFQPRLDSKIYNLTLDDNTDFTKRPVILKVHGSDRHTNSSNLTYSLSGSLNDLNTFEIDNLGNVRLVSKLNYKMKNAYKLNVYAQDLGQPSCAISSELNIHILNKNLNTPSFTAPFYEFIAFENVDVGSKIGRVLVAYDRDSPDSQINFSLDSNHQDDVPFKIESNGSIITVKKLHKKIYEFYVTAVKNSISSSVKVKIKILDTNDQVPEFSKKVYKLDLMEDTAIGLPLLTLVVSNKDPNSLLDFYLEQEDDLFSLIKQSNTRLFLTLEKSNLNFKKKSHYELNCKVVDQQDGLYSMSKIEINILPNIKYFPRFTKDIFMFKINENSLVNSLIGQLSTISNDNQVVYKLINSGTLNENFDVALDFRLDEHNGNLYVSNYLDREKYDTITLYASASYRDKNFRSDHALVQIQIIDTNDNAPVFTRDSYQALVYTNYKIDDYLLRVEAIDKDTGVNSMIKYSILDEEKQPVRIDPSTGVIRLKSNENFQELNLTLVANDLGTPSLSTKTFLLLKYLPEEDTPPFFDVKNLIFELTENQPGGGIVLGEISARDSEMGQETDIIYKILDHNDLFELKPSGMFNRVNLVSRKILSYYMPKLTYNLTIRAYSGPLYSDCNVLIRINEQNQNFPIVPSHFKIIFNNYKNYFLTEQTPRVPVTNFDIALNWSFTLRDKIGQQLINLDARTGEITLKSILNTNNLINTNFTVTINDGEIEVNSTCELLVTMVTDNMISESVTLNLYSIDLNTFMSLYYDNFIDLTLSLVKSKKKSNIHIFNMANEPNGLNLTLSISYDYEKDQFVSSSIVKQIIYSNIDKIKSFLNIKKVIIYEDSSCAIEPCLNFQKCLTNTKFRSASSRYLSSESLQFRRINVQHDFSCSCPMGFTGTNISVMCDTEFNLCYSNPCGQNGVCISTESSYVCVCDPDYTGRVCEINLKKSKCPQTSVQSVDIFTSQVCKNSNCKNLILGGFICDKCASSEEPSASSYYTSLCELRARNFPENSQSYLVLPGLENRLRFKIKLSFSTIKSNSVIFYNGRLSNTSLDFISLEIDDDFLVFKYSLGDQINEIKIDELSVTDGKWRTITIEYKSRHVALSLDNDNLDTVDSCEIQKNFNKTTPECIRQNKVFNLPEKCQNQIETCFRFLDLNGPLIIGKNVHNNYYEGCISDLVINDKLIDLDQFIIDYKTKPGCSSKFNICELNSNKLKKECSTCKHVWSNKIKCECDGENQFFDGKKCLGENTEAYTLNTSSYLLFQEKILQNENEIQISFDLKLNQNSNSITNQTILYVKFSDNLNYYEFFLNYDTRSVNLRSQNLKENVHINIRKNNVVLNEQFWSKFDVKFNRNGLISLTMDDLFQQEIKSLEIKKIFDEKFNYRWSIGGAFKNQGISSCLKNVKLNGIASSPYETHQAEKGCKKTTSCHNTQNSTSCLEQNSCSEACFNSGNCTFMDNDYACKCPEGFKGKYCQYEKQINERVTDVQFSCPARWWGNEPGICGPCNCDETKNFSPDCDKTNGKCQCKSKFYKRVNRITNEEECVPCDCYLEGSTSLDCEPLTGQCKCLLGAGITGRRCDKCVSPFAEMTMKGNECRQIMTNECPKAFAFNIWWPRTTFNQVANSSCPKGSTGVAYRLCTINGWASNLDLSECKSAKIDSHLNKYTQDLDPRINSYQAFKIIEDLSRITRDAELDYDDDMIFLDENQRAIINEKTYNLLSTTQNSLYAFDLVQIQNLTKLILQYEIDNLGSFLYIQDKFFLSKIFSILDEILSKKYELKINQFNYKTDHMYALWTDLIIILKEYMSVLVENGQDYTLNDEINLDFNNIQFGLRNKNQVSYSNFLNFKLDFTTHVNNKLVYTSLNLASYNLPKHLMLNSRQGSISTSTYRVVSNLIIFNTDINNNKSSRIAIEFLLTNNFDVHYDPINNYLNYKNLRNSKLDYNCVYLNTEYKIWSTKGAKFVSYDPSTNKVKCLFDSDNGIFAVLTPSGTFIRNKNNNIINFSIAFNILSIFSLIIVSFTMVLIILIRKTRRPLKVVHLNLCLNLFLNQFIFVFGVNANESQIMCKLIAILEHYFNLSTFVWVFLVSLHLYRMVSELRDVNKIGLSTPVFYYLIGYITPLVIVGLSLGIKHDIYTNYDSTINFLNYPMNKLDLSSVYCWLNIQNYQEIFFIFLVPIGTVTLLILLLLGLSYKQSKKDSYNQTDLDLVYQNMYVSMVFLAFNFLITIFLLLFLNSSQTQTSSIVNESFVYQHLYVVISLSYSLVAFISLVILDVETRNCLIKIKNLIIHKLSEDEKNLDVKNTPLDKPYVNNEKLQVINVNSINAKYMAYRDFNTHSLSTTTSTTSNTFENTDNSQMSDYVKHMFLGGGAGAGGNGVGTNQNCYFINTTNTDTTCESDYNYNYDFNKLKTINNTQSIEECDVVDVGQVLKAKNSNLQNVLNESYRSKSPYMQNLISTNYQGTYSPGKFSNPLSSHIPDLVSAVSTLPRHGQLKQISPHYSENLSSVGSKSSLVHIHPDGTIDRKYYKKAQITSIASIKVNTSVNIEPNLNHEDNETRV